MHSSCSLSGRCTSRRNTILEDLLVFGIYELLGRNDYYNDNGTNSSSSTFRLVTRFPQRIFSLKKDGDILLQNMGFSTQEMLMIEDIDYRLALRSKL